MRFALVLVLTIALGVGIGVGIGAAVGGSGAKATTQTASSQAASSATATATSGRTANTAAGGLAGQIQTGSVQSVGDKSFTITAQGSTITVTVTTTTQILRSAAGSVADLKQGSAVLVTLAQNSDAASQVAASMQIGPQEALNALQGTALFQGGQLPAGVLQGSQTPVAQGQGGQFAGGQRAQAGATPGAQRQVGAAARQVTGTIESVATGGQEMVVKTGSESVKIALNTQTVINMLQMIALSEVKQGATAIVVGPKDASGTVSASLVRIGEGVVGLGR